LLFETSGLALFWNAIVSSNHANATLLGNTDMTNLKPNDPEPVSTLEPGISTNAMSDTSDITADESAATNPPSVITDAISSTLNPNLGQRTEPLAPPLLPVGNLEQRRLAEFYASVDADRKELADMEERNRKSELAVSAASVSDKTAGSADNRDLTGPELTDDPPFSEVVLIPFREKAFLGDPLLLTGEDKGEHDKLTGDIHDFVSPRHVVEEIWVRDAIYHEWQNRRLRQFGAGLINASIKYALAKLLQPLLPAGPDNHPTAAKLAQEFVLGTKTAIKTVEDLLKTEGLTFDSVLAEAMTSRLDTVERFGRMGITAQNQRDSALREIERRRFAFVRDRARFMNNQDGEYFPAGPTFGHRGAK